MRSGSSPARSSSTRRCRSRSATSRSPTTTPAITTAASPPDLRACVLAHGGRHQEARGASKRAIQLNPPLARAQTNLSLERYNAERRSQQLRARESPEPQVVEGNELAHYNLGLAFRQKGYYNEALREYRLALERGEDRRLTLQAMAEGHLLKRVFGAALDLSEEHNV